VRVTPTAAALLRETRSLIGASPATGIRLQRDGDGAPDELSATLDFREGGEPDDTTISEEGLHIYLAADLAEMLEERTLDVEELPSGRVELVVR
jgi:hypothetical protein